MNELIDFLLETADIAHKEHLATGSYAAHKALGDLLRGLRADTDALAESLIALGTDVTGTDDILAELKTRLAACSKRADICDNHKAVENLHLATSGYAAHKALGDFYEGLRSDTDTLAEALIALGNDVTGADDDILAELKTRYGRLLEMRNICDNDKAVENLFDTVSANFLCAIYKLERLI